MKYIRFQARYSGRTGKPIGIFTAFHHLRKRGEISNVDWRYFEEVDSWFKEKLPYPPFYSDGNRVGAVTWFKRSASNEMQDRLSPLVGVLRKYGVELDVASTDDPGEIIYEDDFQVGVIGAEGPIELNQAMTT